MGKATQARVALLTVLIAGAFAEAAYGSNAGAARPIFWHQEAAQDTVRGVVADEAGAPLPGVNVLVKGTNTGAATNVQGAYAVIAAPADSLVFSYVGYQTRTVAVDGRATVDVQLPIDEQSLDEVVVVGYSAKTQQQLPSSVVTVDAEELEGVTAGNVTSTLQGKAAGVYVSSGSGAPGDSPQIRIRGTGSISASADPLYVMDGVISDASVAQAVPPSDVASVTVLKDAAATALYGSRAANGVIVITTKTGSPGKTQVNVQTSVGASNPVFGNFDLMNTRQLYELHQYMEPSTLNEDVLSRNTDWKDLAFRQGVTTTLDLSASGGNEQTTFYVAGNYYQEEGTLVATGFDRMTGRVNLEHQINDHFRVTARAYGTYETRDFNPTGALYQSYTNMPWDEPYNEEGTPKTGREPEWIGRDQSNFLYPMQYNWSDGRYQDYSADLKLTYDITPWLDFSTTNRAKFEYDHAESYNDARTAAGSDNDGELNNSDSFSNTIMTSNLLSASRDFGGHSLSGLLGFEYQRSYYDNISGLGTGIFPGLGVLDVTADPLSLSGGKTESAFASGFFQADYDFEDTYFLTLSFRRDGSSRFGADSRFGNFYSIGGAWMLSNEGLLNDVAAIDQLKLRGSYGTTGNAEGLGDYSSQSRYGYTANYDSRPASVPAWLGDPELTWEVARSLNAGVDARLFSRFDLSVDVYRRVNTNLLQAVVMPGTSGWYSRVTNVGAVRNHGIELSLSTTNVQRALTWTTDFNVGLNRNKVSDLYAGDPILNGNQRIIEGRDLYTWYLREWAGVDPETEDPLWEKVTYDDDGKAAGVELTNSYSEATLQPVGTSTPDFAGGVQNTFQYKGFALSAFINFVYGNEVYHYARQLFDSDGAYPTFNNMVLRDGWSRWRAPGDEATHPKPVRGGNQSSNSPSSRYLEDGSYLRLRNVRLSYNLPQTLLQQVGVRSAQLYVSGDNLLTLTGFSGMDPEVELGGTIGTKYPTSKKVLFGLQLGL